LELFGVKFEEHLPTSDVLLFRQIHHQVPCPLASSGCSLVMFKTNFYGCKSRSPVSTGCTYRCEGCSLDWIGEGGQCCAAVHSALLRV